MTGVFCSAGARSEGWLWAPADQPCRAELLGEAEEAASGRPGAGGARLLNIREFVKHVLGILDGELVVNVRWWIGTSLPQDEGDAASPRLLHRWPRRQLKPERVALTASTEILARRIPERSRARLQPTHQS